MKVSIAMISMAAFFGELTYAHQIMSANSLAMITDNMEQTQTDTHYYQSREDEEANETPEKQSNSNRDLTITQNIRKKVMADDSLSTKAKNIKIITNNGLVTLTGEVGSPRERNAIETKVKSISGVKNIDNELEVKVGRY